MEYKRIGKEIVEDVKYGRLKALDGYVVGKTVAELTSFCYGMLYTNCKIACPCTKFQDTTFRDCVIADCICTNFINCAFVRCRFVNRLMYNDFHDCVFSWCDFGKMRMGCTEFLECKFRKCKVEKVVLSDDMHDIRGKSSVSFFSKYIPMACPRKGKYIGYKKCLKENMREKAIVVLEIPASARRSSAFGKKCRADRAKVLSIHTYGANRHALNDSLPRAVSAHDPHFRYEVGQTVVEMGFDPNRFRECASGIHHYMTLADAEKHVL